LRIQAFKLAADSVAETTQQSYKSAWKKWISFIDTYSHGPFTDKTLRQLSAHQLLEYLVMFVSYCAYDLQCNVRSIPSIMSAVRKGMLLRFVNCDVFDSDLLKAVKQGAARLPAPAHRIRLPCTLDMITHIVQQNTQPPSTTFQFMLATGISMGFYLCLR
jgi:GTPase